MVPDLMSALLSLNEENKYTISTAIENVELVHERFPDHLRMGTARVK